MTNVTAIIVPVEQDQIKINGLNSWFKCSSWLVEKLRDW